MSPTTYSPSSSQIFTHPDLSVASSASPPPAYTPTASTSYARHPAPIADVWGPHLQRSSDRTNVWGAANHPSNAANQNIWGGVAGVKGQKLPGWGWSPFEKAGIKWGRKAGERIKVGTEVNLGSPWAQ